MTEEKTTQKNDCKKIILKTASILLDFVLAFLCAKILCAYFFEGKWSIIATSAGAAAIRINEDNSSLGCWLFGTYKKKLNDIDYIKIVIGFIITILLVAVFVLNLTGIHSFPESIFLRQKHKKRQDIVILKEKMLRHNQPIIEIIEQRRIK